MTTCPEPGPPERLNADATDDQLVESSDAQPPLEPSQPQQVENVGEKPDDDYEPV